MLIAIVILLFFLPASRPYMVCIAVIIGLGLLIGFITPDFFKEEPQFWLGLVILILCLIGLGSYIRDWEKEDRDDRFKYI